MQKGQIGMMKVIASYGKLRIVSFEDGYCITHRHRVVSDRQLALHLKMTKKKLQEITVKHNADIKEEETREISCFKEIIDALECVKELGYEDKWTF